MFDCEVLVAGGSLGGVAAALGAAEEGAKVWLVEETDWIGGQVTSQGVSALDEHEYIEAFGCTETYRRFREAIRSYYRKRYRITGNGRRMPHFNPGNGWVSRLSFEPKIALHVLRRMLAPHVRSRRLRILLNARIRSLWMRDDRIIKTHVQTKGNKILQVRPQILLDATEGGDLLPMAGAEYSIGAESFRETGEPHALRGKADPHKVQSFTFPFVVEYRPGEKHLIPKPKGYESFRRKQPYTLDHFYATRGRVRYGMFQKKTGTLGAFWTYRRLLDRTNFQGPCFPNDVALINWPGNDYRRKLLFNLPSRERSKVLAEAKRLSLGFLYWLQTEAPRDDGGFGYPELQLRKDILDTSDGLSKQPYIREGRRLMARQRIVEQDISAEFHPEARARLFEDSVGVGFYGIDLHGCAGDPDDTTGLWIPTRPFQIPLGALIPIRLRNLLAACKNIGTTHITNGAYRVHPVEWAIGESAGRIAAFCVKRDVDPSQVLEDTNLLRTAQRALVTSGVPIFWMIDVPLHHPAFFAVQTRYTWNLRPVDPNSLKLNR